MRHGALGGQPFGQLLSQHICIVMHELRRQAAGVHRLSLRAALTNLPLGYVYQEHALLGPGSTLDLHRGYEFR